MFEKVNPSHPDKVADRIAGALVDLAYGLNTNDPHTAVEVLIGHGTCRIINETDTPLNKGDVESVVKRITKDDNIEVDYIEVPQDYHLNKNQSEEIRCGDNGIFCGCPVTREQRTLSNLAKEIYEKYPYDGKYVYDELGKVSLIICQSNAKTEDIKSFIDDKISNVQILKINPLGDWTGGPNVDTGATNRKLGSDMGDAVTGGGLHGKDLSKADVSVNIYAHIRAQHLGKKVRLSCAIGDKYVDGLPYSSIVEIARDYIKNLGGFEKFAEWGLI